MDFITLKLMFVNRIITKTSIADFFCVTTYFGMPVHHNKIWCKGKVLYIIKGENFSKAQVPYLGIWGVV